MDTISIKSDFNQLPITDKDFLNSRGGRGLDITFDENNPPTPDDGVPFNPPGRDEREYPDEDESGSQPIENEGSVDSVNTEGDTISTDISSSFGEYGQIFAAIIAQLKSLFSKNSGINNISSSRPNSNPFYNFLAIVRQIADTTDGAVTTNLTNALNQMMSYYMQQISAGIQNQFNIQQWQIQNEYNSPLEQLKRLSAAGLNPLHFFDSGSNGSSTSVTASSGSAPSAGSAVGNPNKFEKAMGITDAALGAASTIGNVALAGKQVAMQAAKLPGEIAQQAQNVVESEQRVGTARAQQALYETQQQQVAQDTAFSKEMQPLLLKSASNNLQLQGQDMVIKGQMSDKIALENENLIEQTKLAVQDYVYNEGMNKLKLDFTEADIKRTYSLVKNQDSITTLNNLRSDFQKSYGIPSESNLSYFLAQKVATGEWTREQFNQFLNDLKLFSGSSSSNAIIYGSNVIAERLSNFIRMFTDASSYNTEPIREYERQGQQMKIATEALQDEFNTYSVDEINAVNGKF